MSEREDNERLLREGIEAYNRHDMDALTEFFDPDVELYIDAGLGNPGTWRGYDGYRSMVTAWRDAFSDDQSEVLSVEAVGERHWVAEMRQRAIGAGSGIPVEMTNAYLFEVRDGRAVRFGIYADRESAIAAARE